MKSKQVWIDLSLYTLIKDIQNKLQNMNKDPTIKFTDASRALAMYHMGLSVIEFDGRKKKKVISDFKLNL